MSTPLINREDIKKAARIMRAVNHKIRQEIIQLLDKKGKLSVSDIYGILKIDQAFASQHLGILRREGIVATEAAGKLRYYSVVHKRLKEINHLANVLASGH